MNSKTKLLSNLVWALQIVWQSGEWLTLATITLVFANGSLPLVGLYLVKLVIDGVTSGLAGSDKASAFAHVGLLIALLGGVYLLESVLASITALVNTAQAQIVTDKMHDILHAKSVEMAL
jgi:ATP-binding cassette subfamily B protein